MITRAELREQLLLERHTLDNDRGRIIPPRPAVREAEVDLTPLIAALVEGLADEFHRLHPVQSKTQRAWLRAV